MSERLDALLAHAGLGSRSEVRRLIRGGRVTVDGVVVRNQGAKIDDAAAVRCRGVPVERPPAVVHAMLHKPVGSACSHDQREAPLIYDLLPEPWRQAGVESAGRLDRATSGLLILSTDGNLVHRLCHPKRKLAKRYRLVYSGALREDAIERCATGFLLPDDERPTLPAELGLNGPGLATLTICEGRHHQVRRMIAALGGEVVKLHRDRIGELDLPEDLAPGAYRELDAADLAALQITRAD